MGYPTPAGTCTYNTRCKGIQKCRQEAEDQDTYCEIASPVYNKKVGPMNS